MQCNGREGKGREEERQRGSTTESKRGREAERQTGKDRFHMLARLIRLIIARMVFVTAPCVDSRCVDGPPHFQRAERVLLGRVCLCAGSFLFAWKMFQERLGILLEVFCLGCALHSVCAVFCIGPHTSRITHSKTSTHQRDKLSPNLHEVSRPGTSVCCAPLAMLRILNPQHNLRSLCAALATSFDTFESAPDMNFDRHFHQNLHMQSSNVLCARAAPAKEFTRCV